MKVLVTGASGFIGSHVVEALLGVGHEVRALLRPTSSRHYLPEDPLLECVHGAVEAPATLAAALGGVEAVIHCAGLVRARSAAELERTNVAGTRHLLEASKGRGLRRWVHLSSLAARGPSPDRETDGETLPQPAPLRPVSDYGRSKASAEEVAAAAAGVLPVSVLRLPVVYGPRDRTLLRFFQAARLGLLPVLGGGGQRVSLVYAADVAQACLRLLTTQLPSGRVYELEDGRPHTQAELALGLERVFGRRVRLLPVPGLALTAATAVAEGVARLRGRAAEVGRDKLRELRAGHWVASSAPARAELGWAPTVTWEEGARRTAGWYRAQGWLR